MRSYHQYCGLAKALDLVGDRWTLLIVRELLILGASRYTDLQQGLPGIATNLLATRLRELEDAGIVARDEAPPPAPATLFRLTARGRQLEPAIAALGAWAGPMMAACAPDDEVRSHWLALPVRFYLTDTKPKRPPITIEVRTGDEPMLIEIAGGEVTARRGTSAHPNAVISGPPQLILGLLLRRLSLAAARVRGLSFHGEPEVLRRIAPRGPAHHS
ncbi:MAG TPA: helix-turn-helix domain-containing protein [Gemmatimonadaceae bacterium]